MYKSFGIMIGGGMNYFFWWGNPYLM